MIGLAVALQLLRAGVRDVIVIEREVAPGMGSTGRANGGVRAQFATAPNVAFSRYTIAQLRELDELSGRLVGFRPIGYLFLAGASESCAALRSAVDVQRASGLDVAWLTRNDVAARFPYIRSGGLEGGAFCAEDGVIDPGGVTAALAGEVRRLGGHIMCGRAITGFGQHHDIVQVQLGDSSVVAEYVVDAAGPQSRDVTAMAGVDLPVLPYRRCLACTDASASLPDVMPMCVDMDTGVLVRREGAGALIAYSDPHESPSGDTGFDESYLDAIAARVGNRYPFLQDVPIDRRKCWAGLYPETPDHQAIIGAVDSIPWLLHCTGFGGHGIMHSLAAGQAVAEIITTGRCSSFDITAFDPTRFERGDLTVEAAVY